MSIMLLLTTAVAASEARLPIFSIRSSSRFSRVARRPLDFEDAIGERFLADLKLENRFEETVYSAEDIDHLSDVGQSHA